MTIAEATTILIIILIVAVITHISITRIHKQIVDLGPTGSCSRKIMEEETKLLNVINPRTGKTYTDCEISRLVAKKVSECGSPCPRVKGPLARRLPYSVYIAASC